MLQRGLAAGFLADELVVGGNVVAVDRRQQVPQFGLGDLIGGH